MSLNCAKESWSAMTGFGDMSFWLMVLLNMLYHIVSSAGIELDYTCC